MVVSNKFYIGYRDVDANLKIKNDAILTFFEDMAGIHAEYAAEGPRTSETVWVLTGYKVNIIKKPSYGETVEIFTWSREIKNFSACREFEIRTENGELLITAISNWAHLNIVSKKLEKISDELAELYKSEPEKTNFEEVKLKKLTEPESYAHEREYFVDWNWIDCNYHMNNIYYLEAAEMALPDEVKIKNEYSGFEIMYKKEIKYKEKIKCFYAELEDEYIITIKSNDLSTLHAIVKLKK